MRKIGKMKKTVSVVLSAALLTGIGVGNIPATNMVARAADQTVKVAEDAVLVKSLDENVSASFWMSEDGEPMYAVEYKGHTVVEPSKLGFSLDFGDDSKDYKAGFRLIDTRQSETVDTQWENPFGDRKIVPERYNETIFELETEDGLRVDLIFRAYDEGAAIKYSFPKDEDVEPFQIKEEYTYFNLDDAATAYVHKNRNQTSVEKIPVTELAAEQAGYFRPMTVTGDGYAMTITEANQVDYTRVNFTVEEGSEPGTIRTMFNGTSDNVDLLPENKTNDVTVDIREQAFDTSWRTFLLGDDEGDLVENNYLIKNLNPECALEDTSWITPGLAFRSGLTTENAKATIDYAVEHNITYVHFDAGWYGPEGDMNSDPWKCIDGFDLDEISKYADEKGVKLVVYLNYRHLENEYNNGRLDDLFKMYVEEWGIDGIKFGFVPVGSQASTKMVYEWVKIAADNKLIVDIHDEMVPTGYERTYPNLLTYEGIHGDEENPTAKDDLGYLFTRMVNGQADHTWCFSNNRNTSKAFRIAGSLVYFSPLIYTYWYDNAANLEDDPATGMWDSMPSVWDESQMLESKMEEYATVLRRSGEEWYLASITAVDRELSVALNMLDTDKIYKAQIYTNKEGDEKNVSVFEYLVDSEDTLKAAMRTNEGYAVRICEATEEELQSLPKYSESLVESNQVVEQIENLESVTVSNLVQVEEQAVAIRRAYEQLSEAQKLAVINIGKLEQIESEIYRLKNNPVEMLYINGEEVEQFSPDQYEYTVNLLGGAEVPTLSCKPYAESQIVSVKQVDAIPGSAEVTVKNPFTEKTYQIHFVIPDSAAEVYAGDLTDYTLDGRKEYKVDRDRGNGVLTLYNEEGTTQTFEKGVGTHANTNIYYQMEGKGATRFQAKCGVSANNGNDTNKVRFKVYKDERTADNLLFDSGDMTQKTPYKAIDVDVSGAKQVILEANDGGDGINNDHANWCDAKFILGEVFTTPIDALVETADWLSTEVSGENQKLLQDAVKTAEAAKVPAEGEELTYGQVYDAAIRLRDVILQVKEEENAELISLMEEAEKKKEGDYTADSWNVFKDAYNQAKMLISDVNTKMESLREISEKLKAAMDGLKASEVTKISTKVLEYALELAEGVSTEGVIPSVAERYETALTKAEEILAAVQNEDNKITQQMVDESWQELILAMQYLSFKQGDKTDLEKVIALAQDMKAEIDSYLDDGKAAFEAALAESITVYEDKDAMQEEVDLSWKKLLSAMAGLQLKPDKSALGELLERVSKLNAADYETSGFAILRSAIAEATAVYEDEQATAQEVERAESSVRNAETNLTLISTAEEEKGSPAKMAGDVTEGQVALGNTRSEEKLAGNQTTEKSAKTGDETSSGAAAVALSAALAALVAFKKKR